MIFPQAAPVPPQQQSPHMGPPPPPAVNEMGIIAGHGLRPCCFMTQAVLGPADAALTTRTGVVGARRTLPVARQVAVGMGGWHDEDRAHRVALAAIVRHNLRCRL